MVVEKEAGAEVVKGVVKIIDGGRVKTLETGVTERRVGDHELGYGDQGWHLGQCCAVIGQYTITREQY